MQLGHMLDVTDESERVVPDSRLRCELAAKHPFLGWKHGAWPVTANDFLPGETSGEIARFGNAEEFVLKMAVCEEDRLKAWHLVYQEYLKMGYMCPQELEYRYSVHDALPGTVTFLVEHAGETVGTVTVFPDSPLGLVADEIYLSELDALRALGRHVVEVGRLAIRDDFKNQRTILINLFDALELHSRCVRGATDLAITVNPAHVNFYQRMLLFQNIGEIREYESVCGAPAVLLRLDLGWQRQVMRWEQGEGPVPVTKPNGRTYYRWFSKMAEEETRVNRMRKAVHPLSEKFIRRYFFHERPLIPNLPSPQQDYFEQCYPGLCSA